MKEGIGGIILFYRCYVRNFINVPRKNSLKISTINSSLKIIQKQGNAYWLDASTDLVIQIESFLDASSEWYYWHGPKRWMPQRFQLLSEYWLDAMSKYEDAKVLKFDGVPEAERIDHPNGDMPKRIFDVR